MKLRVGVIGLGDSWESRYRSALAALNDRFQVRAIHSPVMLLAERAAREFEISPSIGYRAIIGRRDVDAVLVLACDWYGPLPILAACDAGKAIYCSAGLELNLDEALLVRDRVDRSGVSFMAEFPRRLAPATVRLKELIATSLGAPQMVFCNEPPPVSGGQGRTAGPVFSGFETRTLAEAVDWCRYVVDGEPTAVCGAGGEATVDGMETFQRTMHIEFAPTGDRAGSILTEIRYGNPISDRWPEASSFRPPPQMEVVCERGVAFVDLPASLIWYDEAGRHMESLESERPLGEQLLMQFHRGVTSLVRRASGLRDAYRALRVVLKAQQSMRDGRRKRLTWRRQPAP